MWRHAMVWWPRPKRSLTSIFVRFSIWRSACRPRFRTAPRSTREGCVSKRWLKPAYCPQKTTVASSALAERHFGFGIDPRRPKYPISAERVPDGQGFKFTADQVALLLQKGTRDVTAR